MDIFTDLIYVRADCTFNDWYKSKRADDKYSIRMYISYFDETSDRIWHEDITYIRTGATKEDYIVDLEANKKLFKDKWLPKTRENC